MSKYLTIKEAAEYLRVNSQLIRKLMKKNEIAYTRFGVKSKDAQFDARKIFTTKEWLDDYALRNKNAVKKSYSAQEAKNAVKSIF
ncbi:MAG: helix-turn-helix domain-containing protein [Bacteroidota bacterium]